MKKKTKLPRRPMTGEERELAAAAMTDKLTIAVTYDPERGYVGTAPDLRTPVVALSLGGLRRKIEIALLPDDVIVGSTSTAPPGWSATPAAAAASAARATPGRD